jgi:hypothetical protein
MFDLRVKGGMQKVLGCLRYIEVIPEKHSAVGDTEKKDGRYLGDPAIDLEAIKYTHLDVDQLDE